MNIGLIGSGGREHAICRKLCESKITKKVFCFPGNAGTSKIAKNIEVDILDFKKILSLMHFNLNYCQKFNKYNSIFLVKRLKILFMGLIHLKDLMKILLK